MTRLPTINRSALALMARVRSGRGGWLQALWARTQYWIRRHELVSRREALCICASHIDDDIAFMEAEKFNAGWQKTPTLDMRLRCEKGERLRIEREIAEVNAELAALEAGQ